MREKVLARPNGALHLRVHGCLVLRWRAGHGRYLRRRRRGAARFPRTRRDGILARLLTRPDRPGDRAWAKRDDMRRELEEQACRHRQVDDVMAKLRTSAPSRAAPTA